jgi:hypothetical protein
MPNNDNDSPDLKPSRQLTTDERKGALAAAHPLTKRANPPVNGPSGKKTMARRGKSR